MLKPRAGTEAEKSSSWTLELGIVTTSGQEEGSLSQEAVRAHIEALTGRGHAPEGEGAQDEKKKCRCEAG